MISSNLLFINHHREFSLEWDLLIDTVIITVYAHFYIIYFSDDLISR